MAAERLPALPACLPTFSASSTHLFPAQQALSQGLFVMPSLPDGEVVSGPSGASSKGRRRGARGDAAAEAAAGGSGGGLLGGAEGGEVALSLEGLPRHDLELMWVLGGG